MPAVDYPPGRFLWPHLLLRILPGARDLVKTQNKIGTPVPMLFSRVSQEYWRVRIIIRQDSSSELDNEESKKYVEEKIGIRKDFRKKK